MDVLSSPIKWKRGEKKRRESNLFLIFPFFSEVLMFSCDFKLNEVLTLRAFVHFRAPFIEDDVFILYRHVDCLCERELMVSW